MLQKFIIFWHNLSFKQILGVVFLMTLALTVPLTAFLVQREQSIFSLAGDDDPVEDTIEESLVPYPSNPPIIYNVVKFYGKPGDSVLIFGDNFAEAQKESTFLLNNAPLDDSYVTYWSDTEIEIELPNRIGVHNIAINVNGHVASWFGSVVIASSGNENVIEYDRNTRTLFVSNPDLQISVYSVSSDLSVTGTENYEINSVDIPTGFVYDDIVYIQLLQNGTSVPFVFEEL